MKRNGLPGLMTVMRILAWCAGVTLVMTNGCVYVESSARPSWN